MKHFVFCGVFLVLFRSFDTILDGCFTGCLFRDNDTTSIYLHCDDVTKMPQDNCTSRIDSIESAHLLTRMKKLKVQVCKIERKLSLTIYLAMKFAISLRELDLSYNTYNLYVEDLLNSAPFAFSTLEFFNVSHSETDNIPKAIQDKMPNLVEFDLSFNKVTQINDFTFRKLKSLNLSSNQLSSLDSKIFVNLTSLEYLDLRGNPITKMADDTFIANVNLKKLRIDELLVCAIFSLKKLLTAVEVYWEYIHTLNTTCEDHSIQIDMENDELVIRVPNNDNLMRFTKENLTSVKTAEFGRDQLKNTTNVIDMLGTSITHLKVSGNFIGELPKKLFDRLDGLTWLELSETKLIISDFNPFENLPKLEDLDISKNNLKYLDITVLAKTLANLFTFNVSGNNLRNIQDVISCLNSKIFGIFVGGNPLKELIGEMFAKFESVVKIDLSNTTLQSFDFNVFKHCISLTSISISNNHLAEANFTLPSGKNSSLNELYVDGNKLTELAGLNSASYPSLVALNVAGNPMPCEYVKKLKEQWTSLQIIGNPCKEDNFSIAVTYGVPIGIMIIVASAFGVAWFIHSRNKPVTVYQVPDHIYEEIGPPTNDPPYNHLEFGDQPNGRILEHYDNNGRNQRVQNNGLDIGENIEMGEQNIDPYNRLNFDAPPNNKILEHYDNAMANQDEQNGADEAEALEVDQPNDDPPYNHLQFVVPPPNNKILQHYKNVPPQNQVDNSSDSSDSE